MGKEKKSELFVCSNASDRPHRAGLNPSPTRPSSASSCVPQSHLDSLPRQTQRLLPSLGRRGRCRLDCPGALALPLALALNKSESSNSTRASRCAARQCGSPCRVKLEHLIYTYLDILDVLVLAIWSRSVITAHVLVFSRKWGAGERHGCECGKRGGQSKLSGGESVSSRTSSGADCRWCSSRVAVAVVLRPCPLHRLTRRWNDGSASGRWCKCTIASSVNF